MGVIRQLIFPTAHSTSQIETDYYSVTTEDADLNVSDEFLHSSDPKILVCKGGEFIYFGSVTAGRNESCTRLKHVLDNKSGLNSSWKSVPNHI